MIGKRVEPDRYGYLSRLLNPGDYVKVAPQCNGDGSPFTDDQRQQWWNQPYFMAETPNGHGANLARHDVTEHEDGTITVSPSILVGMRVDGNDVELWHGYLQRGVWRAC